MDHLEACQGRGVKKVRCTSIRLKPSVKLTLQTRVQVSSVPFSTVHFIWTNLTFCILKWKRQKLTVAHRLQQKSQQNKELSTFVDQKLTKLTALVSKAFDKLHKHTSYYKTNYLHIQSIYTHHTPSYMFRW
jgi:hypothetical protein